MKVITEERLDHLIKTDGDGSMVYCTVSRADLQEIDQLTVTRLRPMSEAPEDDWFIAYDLDGNLCQAQRSCDKYIRIFKDGFIEDWCQSDDFIGWIPLPTYKPEQS